jgi:hypothetical protein
MFYFKRRGDTSRQLGIGYKTGTSLSGLGIQVGPPRHLDKEANRYASIWKKITGLRYQISTNAVIRIRIPNWHTATNTRIPDKEAVIQTRY